MSKEKEIADAQLEVRKSNRDTLLVRMCTRIINCCKLSSTGVPGCDVVIGL